MPFSPRIATAFNRLEQSIKEAEGTPDTPFTLEAEKPAPAFSLGAERDVVVSIVRGWWTHARYSGKKTAQRECERVLAFIEKMCP